MLVELAADLLKKESLKLVVFPAFWINSNAYNLFDVMSLEFWADLLNWTICVTLATGGGA